MPRVHKTTDIVDKLDNKKDAKYYLPLQTVQQDGMTMDTVTQNEEAVKKKIKIPPITVVKTNAKSIHDLMQTNKITDYSIKIISIGLKIFADTDKSFIAICSSLKDNQCEYYTHDKSDAKPYKAILSGLDKVSCSDVKEVLVQRGLKCTDVRIVEKKTRYNLNLILYIVYFENNSINLQELKKEHCNIFHTKIRWEYKRKQSNSLTQCYNC